MKNNKGMKLKKYKKSENVPTARGKATTKSKKIKQEI